MVNEILAESLKTCVTCSQMKELENAADAAGLSYYQMMENAGYEAAKIVTSFLGLDALKPTDIINASMTGNPTGFALVFCGKGNNGGDGFVAARALTEKGVSVKVALVEGDPKTPDSKENFELLKGLPLVEIIDSRNAAFNENTVIIDAIYGTGFHGAIKENAGEIIDFINSAREIGAKVFALDIPSGLSGDAAPDEDLSDATCVHADTTISFHAAKPIHKNKTAQEFIGDLVIADIGITDTLKMDL